MCPIDTKYDTTYTKERRGENVKMGEIIAAHTYLICEPPFCRITKNIGKLRICDEKSPSGSSHCTFRKPGCQPITIPKHDPIKRIYIEKVREVVEKETPTNENTE